MNVHSPSRIQSASMACLLSVDAFYQILRSGFIIMQPPGFYKRESKTAVRERRKIGWNSAFPATAARSMRRAS